MTGCIAPTVVTEHGHRGTGIAFGGFKKEESFTICVEISIKQGIYLRERC